MQRSGLAHASFPAKTLVFSSNDPQQVTRDVARIFKPHRLRVAGSDRALHAKMSNIRHGQLSVSRLEYGADVEIDPDRLDDFFLVQIPVAGTADIACGNVRFESSPRAASLVSPTLPLRMRWYRGNSQVCVRFERAFVQDHCAALLGRALDRPLEFDPNLSLETPAGRYFLRLLGVFVDELALADRDDACHPLMKDRVGDQFAASLLNALLYGQTHTFGFALARAPEHRSSPHFVRRAEEYLRAHFRDFVTVERLAEVAGVSTRTLFSGFREYRGTTPMGYLRDLRLEHARASLLSQAASDPSHVTNVALDCGFSHLGRFAASYRERFGETPSATARFRNVRC